MKCAELRLRKLLDPVVTGVGDVDVAVSVDRDAAGMFELAGTRALAAPGASELAAGCELLDPAVVVVGDVDAAVGVDRDALGLVELATTRTLAPPGTQEPAVAGELL